MKVDLLLILTKLQKSFPAPNNQTITVFILIMSYNVFKMSVSLERSLNFLVVNNAALQK